MILEPIKSAELIPAAHASPDEQVAEKIVAALLEAGLMEASKKESVIAKLASGKMKTADWKVLLELKKPNGSK